MQRKPFVALLAAVVAAWLAWPALAASTARDVAELQRLETVWNQAHLHRDAPALDQLWGDDLVIAAPRMLLNRTEALNVWRAGTIKFTRYESSDLVIRVYGNAAVVTGRLQRTRELPDGQTRDDDWRFTKVYVRQRGAWKVVAFHASEAPQPS